MLGGLKSEWSKMQHWSWHCANTMWNCSLVWKSSLRHNRSMNKLAFYLRNIPQRKVFSYLMLYLKTTDVFDNNLFLDWSAKNYDQPSPLPPHPTPKPHIKLCTNSKDIQTFFKILLWRNMNEMEGINLRENTTWKQNCFQHSLPLTGSNSNLWITGSNGAVNPKGVNGK